MQYKLKTRWQLLHIVLHVLSEVVPGVLEGWAAGQDVGDVIHGVRARVGEETDSTLVLAPVTTESFSPITPRQHNCLH